jgi:hypothetical protein
MSTEIKLAVVRFLGSRAALVVCSLYVALPALFGLFCGFGLLLVGMRPNSQGLLLGAGCGIVIGVPIAALQLSAVFWHRALAARVVSWIYWLAVAVWSLGILNLFLWGHDDGSPFQLWPEAIVILVIFGLNLFTALCMGCYGRTLDNSAG